jgi:hypothetical protein
MPAIAAVGVVLLIALFVVSWWAYLRADVKFRIWRDPDFAHSGKFSATKEVMTRLSCSEALVVAKKAMEDIGAKQAHLVPGDAGSYVLGWIGTNLVNLGSASEYQLLVSAREVSDGHAALSCSARLRVAAWVRRGGLIGSDRSSEHVARLVKDIGSQLATRP